MTGPAWRIVSDGTGPGTTITHNGEPVEDVVRAVWTVTADGWARLALEIDRAAVDAAGGLRELATTAHWMPIREGVAACCQHPAHANGCPVAVDAGGGRTHQCTCMAGAS